MFAAHGSSKANARSLGAAPNDFFEAGKRTAANKQNVGGVDLQHVLVGVLAPTLGGHRCCGAFNQLEQRLLHTLARHVSRNRRVFRLARDLVDLVNINNALLGFFHIVVAGLKQFGNDVFHIFAHITRFGEGGGVSHDKRHIEHARHGGGQQGFARARGSNQQNITFNQLHRIFFGGTFVTQALVVVVHRHGQGLFGVFLANHIVVEVFFELCGRGQGVTLIGVAQHDLGQLVADDVVTQVDAFVANKHRGACNQFFDLVLAFATKRAEQVFLGGACFFIRHGLVP